MSAGRIALIAAALVAFAVGANAVEPGALNTISFVNNTGLEIHYLFFSPADSDSWGADLLGTQKSLDHGERRGFYIHFPEDRNRFDFLAIDEDGDAYIIWDFTISDPDRAAIEITREDFEGGYDLPSLATVDLVNATGRDVVFLFFSPADSEIWGIDMLDEETILETGETLSLLVPVGAQRTGYELLALGLGEARYESWVELTDARLRYRFPIGRDDLVE